MRYTRDRRGGRADRMPKLIERLLRQFQRPSASVNDIRKVKRQRRSRQRQSISAPADWTSPRSHSIILDPVNPLIHREKYRLHKSDPPPAISQTSGRPDVSREPVGIEHDWWTNPYCASDEFRCRACALTCIAVRMLASPIRKCILTHRYLPKGALF